VNRREGGRRTTAEGGRKEGRPEEVKGKTGI